MIVTATSRRQGNAIASEIDQAMKKLGEAKLGLEGSEEGRWILIDYGDFVVHIFSPEDRAYYCPRGNLGRRSTARLERARCRKPLRRNPEPIAPDLSPIISISGSGLGGCVMFSRRSVILSLERVRHLES